MGELYCVSFCIGLQTAYRQPRSTRFTGTC